MRYVSTRGLTPPQSFKDVLLAGLAPDGGLFVPEEYPQYHEGTIDTMRGLNYTQAAQIILADFIDDIPTVELNKIIARTYTPNMAPHLKWLDEDLALLALSNGPTLSFKDQALQLLGRLMEYVLREKDEKLNILGATSGDTGSAAEYAYRGREGMQVFMLSPYGRMSRFQQQQMYSLNDPSIHNLVVDGNFDDCQAIVKAVNADACFKEKHRIGAVNSINWARIAAQVVYWAYASLQATKKPGDVIDVSVPSGNFGNALSAYIAKRMGFPIRNIIVATNENDVLHEFFRYGFYRIRAGDDVKITSSPSMDIASASNFERLMFDCVDRDAYRLRLLLDTLQLIGRFVMSDKSQSLDGFCSGSATDEEVIRTIRTVYTGYGATIDPHTAVGMKVAFDYQYTHTDVPLIVAETAHPAKFADTIREALEVEPPIPKGYEMFGTLPEHITRVPADPAVIKQYIMEHV